MKRSRQLRSSRRRAAIRLECREQGRPYPSGPSVAHYRERRPRGHLVLRGRHVERVRGGVTVDSEHVLDASRAHYYSSGGTRTLADLTEQARKYWPETQGGPTTAPNHRFQAAKVAQIAQPTIRELPPL